MKRNLLIGTSLVAAFATTNLNARSAAVMTDAAFKENTAVANAVAIAKKEMTHFLSESAPLHADGTVAVSNLLARALADEAGVKAVAGVLSAKTAESQTPDALVAALRKQTATQRAKSIEAIAAALATNPTLRRIVDASRTEVEALIKEEAARKAVDGKVDVKPNPNPTPAPAKVDTEAAETVEGLVDAMNAAVEAYESSANKVARFNAVWKDAELAAAEKAEDLEVATEAETAAGEALTSAAAELTAKEKAATDAKAAVERLEADRKALADTLPAAQAAAAGKVANSGEVLALNALESKIIAKDAEIAAAKATQTAADAALAAAKTAKADAEAELNAAKEAKVAATAASEAAATALSRTTEKLKTAKAELDQKLAALEAARAAALTAAETAAKNAATALTAAKTVKANADVAVTEAETALDRATATATELAAREVSLKKERDAARAAAAANEGNADLADTVTAKEAAVKEIVAQIADAEVALSKAKKLLAAKQTAAEKATKELEAAEKAAADTKAEFETVKLTARTQAEEVRALRANIEAAGQERAAARTEFEAQKDARRLERALAAKDAEIARLAAAHAANPSDPEAERKLREAEAGRRKLNADRVAALQAVTEAVDARKKAEGDSAVADERARVAAEQAKAAKESLEAARTANTTLESQLAALRALAEKVPGFEAEVARLSGVQDEAAELAARVAALDTAAILDRVIADANAEIQTQDEVRADALRAIDALKAETVVIAAVEADAEAEEEGHPAVTLADIAERRGLSTLGQLRAYLAEALEDSRLEGRLAHAYRLIIRNIDTVTEADAAIEKAEALRAQAEQFQGIDFVEGEGETSARVAAVLNSTLRQIQGMVGFAAKELAAGHLVDFAGEMSDLVKVKELIAKFNAVKDLLDIELPAAEEESEFAPALRREVSEMEEKASAEHSASPVLRSVPLRSVARPAISAEDAQKFAVVRELRDLVSNTDLNPEYISGMLSLARAYVARLDNLDPSEVGGSWKSARRGASSSDASATQEAKEALRGLIERLEAAEKAVAKAVATGLDRLVAVKANARVYAEIKAVEARIEDIRRAFDEAGAAFEAGAEGRAELDSGEVSRLESEFEAAQRVRAGQIDALQRDADSLRDRLQRVEEGSDVDEHMHNLERYNVELKTALTALTTALRTLKASKDSDFITDAMIVDVFAPHFALRRSGTSAEAGDVEAREAARLAAARRNFAGFQGRVGPLDNLDAAYRSLRARYDELAAGQDGLARELGATLNDADRTVFYLTDVLGELARDKAAAESRLHEAVTFLSTLDAARATITKFEDIQAAHDLTTEEAAELAGLAEADDTHERKAALIAKRNGRRLTEAETRELDEARGRVGQEGRATDAATHARGQIREIETREAELSARKESAERHVAELRAALETDAEYAALRSRSAELRGKLDQIEDVAADLRSLEALKGQVGEARFEKADEIRGLARRVAGVIGTVTGDYEGPVKHEVAREAEEGEADVDDASSAGSTWSSFSDCDGAW